MADEQTNLLVQPRLPRRSLQSLAREMVDQIMQDAVPMSCYCIVTSLISSSLTGISYWCAFLSTTDIQIHTIGNILACGTLLGITLFAPFFCLSAILGALVSDNNTETCGKIMGTALLGGIFIPWVVVLLFQLEDDGEVRFESWNLIVVIIAVIVLCQSNYSYWMVALVAPLIGAVWQITWFFFLGSHMTFMDCLIFDVFIGIFSVAIDRIFFCFGEGYGYSFEDSKNRRCVYQAIRGDGGATNVLPVQDLIGFLDRVDELNVEEALYGNNKVNLEAAARLMNETLPDLRDTLEVTRELLHSETTNIIGVHEEELLAIMMMTLNEPYQLFKIVNFPFLQEERSRTSVQNQAVFMKLLLGGIRNLMLNNDGLIVNGPAYRCVNFTATNRGLWYKYEHYKEAFPVDHEIVFAPFSSFSTDERVAEQFAGRRPNGKWTVWDCIRAPFSSLSTEEIVEGQHPGGSPNGKWTVWDYIRGRDNRVGTIKYIVTNFRGIKISDLSVFIDEEEVVAEPPLKFKVVACTKVAEVVVVTLRLLNTPNLCYLTGRPSITGN